MKRKQVLITILIALSSLLAVLIAILINLATSTIPHIVKPYLPFAWPLIGIVTLVVMIVAIHLSRLQAVDKGPTLTQQNKVRQQMLTKVHSFWISGVLEQSLHYTVLITLGLLEQRTAVKDPWRLVLQRPDQSARLLPADTPIVQVYDDVGGELLILGEPGSGKTTLLLELARNLINRAREDENAPMPVVFNLSSWTEKQPSLTDWIVDELNSKYQVSRRFGQSWVMGGHILPLLDGLDEVALLLRGECIKAINEYRREHGLVPMVVCSRSSDYLEQKQHLHLNSAVVIQPLTAQQIYDYFLSAGEKLVAVQMAFQADPILQELATTPLMLNVLALAYQGLPFVDLPIANSLDIQRRRAFAVYVQRMLQRRGLKTRYTQQQTVNWLAWIAKQSRVQGETVFYNERILSLFVPFGPLPWSARIVLGLWSGLINAFLIGCPLGLVFGLAIGVFGAVFAGLLDGVLVLLSVGSVNIMSDIKIAIPGLFTELIDKYCFGLFGKLLVSFIFGFITFLLKGILDGFITCLVIVLIFSLISIGTATIRQIFLRLYLWHTGYIPWNYTRFLDFAAERILLRKVGGGYIFIHQLLLDYFATLKTTPTSKKERIQTQYESPEL